MKNLILCQLTILHSCFCRSYLMTAGFYLIFQARIRMLRQIQKFIIKRKLKKEMKTGGLPALCSNIVYQFLCSCDSSLTYIGVSTRHLSIRVGEHLGFHLKTERSVKNHVMSCDICANTKFNVNLFKIIKKCYSDFETKFHEALLIKKHNFGFYR